MSPMEISNFTDRIRLELRNAHIVADLLTDLKGDREQAAFGSTVRNAGYVVMELIEKVIDTLDELDQTAKRAA